MKFHPRATIVSTARADLSDKIREWYKAHENLTGAELFWVIGSVLGDEITGLARESIRDEQRDSGEAE